MSELDAFKQRGKAMDVEKSDQPETSKISGTENYRSNDKPVGARAIEEASILGHDNLEAETEKEKEIREQGETRPDASFSS